jgi:uncharacterized protein with PQ loop repeat
MNDYPTLEEVATSVQGSTLAFIHWLGGAAFVLGLICLVLLARRLIDVGHDRRSGHAHAFFLSIAAALFLFFGEWIQSLNVTVYGTPAILVYRPAAPNWITGMVAMVILIIKAIGVLAMVRGINLWRYAGHESSLALGAVSRGLFFVVAGIATANIVLTNQAILWTVRLGNPLD